MIRIDAATLDIVEDLLTHADVHHLMLICAYRDNEVDSFHPLMRKLEAIQSSGAAVQEIRLSPLDRECVTELVMDALHISFRRAAPLAQLVHEKTAGNPFFVIQFLRVLVDECLLVFAHDAAQWSWNLDGIHAKAYTVNVVDLMAGKLTRLPAQTKKALQQLACVGNAAEITMLSTAFGMSEEEVHAYLWEAVLRADWILTHELVHTALPSLADDQHWLEEGIATYVEPIARFQSGFLSKEQVWSGMVDGMPHGEPGSFDRGLDNTHTWGRTYWGGALFCLIADIRIRQQTKNAFGLQDALAAIVRAHGSIEDEWPIERVLAVADRKTGTTVLEDLYKSWRATPVEIDLAALWIQLGVRDGKDGVTFDKSAPLTSVRDTILNPR
jgi:hypothetical protein